MHGSILTCVIQHSFLLVQHVSILSTPTQEEVFKSIQTNVDEPSSGGRVLPFLMAAAALFILLALFTQRRKREFSPKALNHHGKLLKEVFRTVPLRSAEIKQLKLLAEASRSEHGPTSPLTLLLCPSLLVRSIRNRPMKIEPKALTQLIKKLGVEKEIRPKPGEKPAGEKPGKDGKDKRRERKAA